MYARQAFPGHEPKATGDRMTGNYGKTLALEIAISKRDECDEQGQTLQSEFWNATIKHIEGAQS